MPKYLVPVTVTVYGFLEVEATSAEEAYENGRPAWNKLSGPFPEKLIQLVDSEDHFDVDEVEDIDEVVRAVTET